jgi:hypothetical protein
MNQALFRVPTLIVWLVITIVVNGRSQAVWDTYLARYEAGLGSVLLNMEVAHSAPRRELPYLLITGVSCRVCTGDGFPIQQDLKQLYRLSADVNRELFTKARTKYARNDVPHSITERASSVEGNSNSQFPELVGTFTYQCQRLDYIYVADTLGIRETLESLYSKHYKRYTFHIQFMKDPDWDAYLKFLYPNESVRTFMMNNRAVTRMTDMGDVPSRPRFVEHLIYFDTIEDRELFISYIGRMKYDIKDARDTRRDSLRYQVRLAKFGTVSLEELNNQTTYLSTKARSFNGVYDGWETKLIGTKQRVRLLCNAIAEPTNTAK